MARERRSFGSIELRRGAYRARYIGPDRQRYEAPHAFAARIDAGFGSPRCMGVHTGNVEPPLPERGSELETLSGYAKRCMAERDRTPRTREEYSKLLERLIIPTLGAVQ